MITDIRNLGPPMKATPDLRAAKSEKSPEVAQDQEDSGSDSFEQTLKEKVSRGTAARESRSPNQAEKPESSESRIQNKVDRKADRQSSQIDSVTATKGEKVEGKGLSERQRVMQNFMDSMESEFGIPPQRLVEAMAQLPEDMLLSSPEETASEVMAQLELKPEETQAAEAMYIAMLAQLSGTLPQVRDPQPLSIQQKVVMGAGGLVAGATAPRLISSRERREALNLSLDKMNSKFFVNPMAQDVGGLSSPVLDSPIMNSDSLAQRTLALSDYANYSKPVNSKIMESMEASQPAGSVIPVDSKLSGLTDRMQPMSKQEANEQLLKGLMALGAAAGALSHAANEGVKGESSGLKMETAIHPGQVQMQSMAAQNAKGETSFQFQGDSEKNGGFGDTQTAATAGLMTSETTPFFVDQKMASEGIKESPRADVSQVNAGFLGAQSKSEVEPNVQQVMSQTQYLIKKGGGEAKVTMSPEGMGQVHLKVLVNEGKVNVQMQTETVEAKKAIESSLNDLKASLNTHRLAIDHVKVDVGNQTSNDSSHQQQKMDFKQDPGREQARQFLGQFREDNSGNRSGFYETPGIKAYSTSRPVVPTPANAESRRHKGSGKGSGLDLVA